MSDSADLKKLPVTARVRAMLGAATRGASFPTLDQLKEMLGILPSDTSQDDAILAQFATTIRVVESYLGRGVAFVAGAIQNFEPVETRNARLMLFRFPVSAVNSVSVDGVAAVTGWRFFPASGILEFPQGCGCGFPRSCCDHEPILVVDYDGGYPDDAWPDDLLDAILRAFFARWHATGDTGNSADISAQAPIRTVATDGSTVTWGDFQASAADSGGGPIPPELLAVSAQLDPYRQRLVTGV